VSTDAGGQDIELVGGDPIDVEQASLDSDQTGGVKYATAEDISAIRQMIEQQNSTVAAQVNGLASKVDTGLNAIRRDTREESLKRIEEAEALNRERFLARIQDDNPTLALEMKGYLENQDTAARQRAAIATQPEEAVGDQAQSQAAQQGWNQVYGHVRSLGLNPTDQRIDYAVLTNTALSEEDRMNRFNGQLSQLIRSAAPATNTAEAQPGPQGGTIVNPPREAGPAGARANFRSGEDILDAFTANNISKAQAVESLRRVDPGLLDDLGWQ